jgi:hypothetical protein
VSVFSTPTRYRVIKITCYCSEIILQSIKYTKIYSGSGYSLKVIAPHPVV